MQLNIGDFTLNLKNQTIIMGILNLSQDSPVKNSVVSLEIALERAYKLRSDGAKIIDVGAHSTSSKAKKISTKEEINTVIPLISQLIDEGFLVSLDSWNPRVVEEAAKNGLGLVNDVNGLQNTKMIEIIKKYDLSACIMHMRGDPQGHYKVDQYYDDITKDISIWFENRLTDLENYGVSRKKLILDPGFEFGKSMKDNLNLLNNLSSFFNFRLPLLVSASNKGFIAEAIGLGRTQQGEGLLEATIAVQTLSAYLGAHILRVHDVKDNFPAIEFINKMKNESLRREK